MSKKFWEHKKVREWSNYVRNIKDSEMLKTWVSSHGVQILGGCCGTGPEHIRILKEQLPKHLPS